MDKSQDDEPGFSFAELASADNYKKWAWKMCYSLEPGGLWDHTVIEEVNPQPVAVVLKDKDFEDDAKRERQEKRAKESRPGPRTTESIKVILVEWARFNRSREMGKRERRR